MGEYKFISRISHLSTEEHANLYNEEDGTLHVYRMLENEMRFDYDTNLFRRSKCLLEASKIIVHEGVERLEGFEFCLDLLKPFIAACKAKEVVLPKSLD